VTDYATPNLPSRDFSVTAAFWARLGFAEDWRDDGWMILSRGRMEVEFFPHPGLDPRQSWFSACLRVDDLDGLYREWQGLGLSGDPQAIPRLGPVTHDPPVPRMFALIDPDGSLIRVLENG
jgi:catechol 2,3-dioxygenase-like lactoylglutathione lyase family enzyme